MTHQDKNPEDEVRKLAFELIDFIPGNIGELTPTWLIRIEKVLLAYGARKREEGFADGFKAAALRWARSLVPPPGGTTPGKDRGE